MTNRDCKSLLRDGFRYDLYANLLWLPRIVASGGEPEQAIFEHILAASKVWIIRFGKGVSPASPPKGVLSETTLHTQCDDWLQFIEAYEYEARIEYTNFRGQPAACAFGDIARQALNHGTYHRGQLRQRFEDQALDFPETDFLLYAAGRSL